MGMKLSTVDYVFNVTVYLLLGGEFGAMMQVHIQNDGPVTLQFETPNLPPSKEVWGKKNKL